ncbi:hypothetical protein [Rhodococcus opacus]|uniref:hypothetical protein n=1 Tax=Rhodococcus opacus TaxID=37919 RepID=UPI0024750E53|nr:hypothetical protein [Rhodococcus opacus]
MAKIRHPTDRKLVRSFVTWQHLRILRRKSETAPTTYAQIVTVRSDLKACTELVNWLRDRELDLATCGQGDIDRFLATGPTARRRIKAFVGWASRHGFPNALTIKTVSKSIATPIEEDERWTLTRELLHNEAITLADRFAGLLILLFSQQASKIVTLTVDHLTQSDRTVSLQLGNKPLELPDPLGAMATRLATNRTNYIQIARVRDQPWLFPGGHPGRPLTASRMSIRMNRIGIYVRPSRQATLIDLAAQLPHPVLSQLLGISASTASKWSTAAGSSNGRYAAHLVRRARGASAEPAGATMAESKRVESPDST